MRKSFEEVCGMRIPLLGLRLLRLGSLLFYEFEFIEQCFVADLKDLRRLPSIPPGLMKHALDVFALRLHRRLASDFEQRRSTIILKKLRIAARDRGGGRYLLHMR